MSRPLVISSTDTTYVPCRVSPGKQAGVRTNPSTVPVSMAFMQNDAEPTSGDWKAAVWDVDATGAENVYEVRCLIGPVGGVVLANGEYRVWVRIEDLPENVVKRSGRLVIT